MRTLGVLASAGFDPFALVETRSWDQIALLAESIALDRVEMISLLLSPIIGEITPGAKVSDPVFRSRGRSESTKRASDKPATSRRGRDGKLVTSIDYSDPEAVRRAKMRDARILLNAGSVNGLGLKL